MARARNIKPGLFKNELLGVADPHLTILFTGLWCLADREGRLEDRPLRIKAEIFPYRENTDVNGYLTELSRLDFIQRYTVGGIAYIQICNFKKHQAPHNTEKPSDIPDSSKKDEPIQHDESLTVKQPLNIGELTEAKRPDSLIPDSLIPDSRLSDSLITDLKTFTASPAAKAVSVKAGKPESKTSETWNLYSLAYVNRYSCEPVRNAKINGQLGQLVDRLGATDAPQVAAYYVSHNSAYYIQRGHAVDALLRDCEKLRTEWATGRTITQTKARQMDKTASNVFLQLLQESQNANK